MGHKNNLIYLNIRISNGTDLYKLKINRLYILIIYMIFVL